jgi:hypothetical protein
LRIAGDGQDLDVGVFGEEGVDDGATLFACCAGDQNRLHFAMSIFDWLN